MTWPIRWTALAVLYMAGLFALSSVPDDGSELGDAILFPSPDVQNLLHVPVYAGLCWLWWKALTAYGVRNRRAVLVAAAITVGFGVIDEVNQTYVEGRFGSATDAVLDAVGAALVVAWAWTRTRHSRRIEPDSVR